MNEREITTRDLIAVGIVCAAVVAIVWILAGCSTAQARIIEPGTRTVVTCSDLYGGGYRALPYEDAPFRRHHRPLKVVDVSAPPFAAIANVSIIDYQFGVRVITSDGDVREIYGGEHGVRYRDRCHD